MATISFRDETTGELVLFTALKGDDGRSAYEVAVDNGFTGTEEEWLESLKSRLVIDDEISDDSENPVQSKAIYEALQNKANTSDIPTTASDIGADEAGMATSAVSTHNTSTTAHDDIRTLINGLSQRLNGVLDSDDTTLDQLSEIVTYIKANRGFIEGITTSKVSVDDIIDVLTSTDTKKPLSANQGRVLAELIQGLTNDKANASDINDMATKTWVGQQGFKTTDTNTTYTFSEGATNGAFNVKPSDGDVQTVIIHGLGSAAFSDSIDYLEISGGTIAGSLTVTGNITANGNITGAKVYNAVWNADYAEGFEFDGRKPEPGEIVELCGEGKVKIASARSDLVVGVCSDSYCILAGCHADDIKNGRKSAIGLVGKVSVKVTGKVKFGDYIVCGGDGIGIVDNNAERGRIVARAIESKDSDITKRVKCLIRIH